MATSQPTTLSLANGSLGAFVTTENGTLQELRLSDGVWLWGDAGRPPGTAVVGTPAILTGADDQFTVVVRGADGKLYEYQPAGATWSKIGAPGGATIVGDPSVALNPASGYPTVFAVGGAGRLQMAYQQGLYWHWSASRDPSAAVGAMGGVSVVSDRARGGGGVRRWAVPWRPRRRRARPGAGPGSISGCPRRVRSAAGALRGPAGRRGRPGVRHRQCGPPPVAHRRRLVAMGRSGRAGAGSAVRAGSSPTVLETPAGGLGVWVLATPATSRRDAYSTADHDWAWVDLDSLSP